ncbi:MAG: TatD family hydrolase [Deltaproteobacteria bacterium]|nr:TatD family hydrolase [Candidatus Zymogenaceae bacterium]
MKPIPKAAQYIDAHAHLDLYRDGGEKALQEIEAHGILTISAAMNPASYRETFALAEKSDLVIPAFGVHPWEAQEYADRTDTLDAGLLSAPVIGEVGLDFRYVTDKKRYPAQERVFEYFLSHAGETGKILNLHTTGAEKTIAERLRSRDITRAIIHWYSGPKDALGALIDIGCYFTVGVEILFSRKIRDIARRIPLDRLLTETDNPVGIVWYRKDIPEGTPSLIFDVIGALADLHRMSTDDLARRIIDNVTTLTRDDPHLTNYRRRMPADTTVPAYGAE